MRKNFLILLFTLFIVFGVQSQELPKKRVLTDALVSQVVNGIATLTQNGRTFEVDGTKTITERKYIKGRRYYTIIEMIDCNGCVIPQAEARIIEISVEQNKIDINDAIRKYNETLKKYEK